MLFVTDLSRTALAQPSTTPFMTTKTDPYATKLHKRVDALLFVLIVLLIAFFLRTSARGEAILSVMPQPFWTSLQLFKAEPKMSLVLVVPNFVTQGQPNYAAANGADFSALMFSDSSNNGFTPMVAVPEKRSAPTGSANFEPDNAHRSSGSSGPSLADNWSKGAGVGSTIPSYSTGFGLISDNSSSATLETPQSETIAAAIDHSPRYAGEPEGVSSGRGATSGAAAQQSRSANTSAALTAPAASVAASFVKADSPQTIAALTIAQGAPDAITALFTWDGHGGSNSKWSNNVNWSGNVVPGTSGNDIAFGGINKLTPAMDAPYSILSLTFNSGAGAFNLTSNGTEILTLGAGGIINNSTTLQTITSPLVLGAAQIWNASSGALTINSSTVNTGGFGLTISGANNTTIANVVSNTGSLTKNGAGTLTLSGASTYSGGTFFGNSGGSTAGTLALGSSSVGAPGAVTSGPIGTGTLTLRGTGASSTIRSTNATARTINNAIVFSGTSIDIHYGSVGTGDLTFGGAANLGFGNRIFTIDNTNTTFSGVISGAGGG